MKAQIGPLGTSRFRRRNMKGRPCGVDFVRRSLRSDCRQGSRPACAALLVVPRSASLTASSLRLLSFHGEAGAPPFLVVPDSDFMNFP